MWIIQLNQIIYIHTICVHILCVYILELLDYDKNHNHIAYCQYWDYLLYLLFNFGNNMSLLNTKVKSKKDQIKYKDKVYKKHYITIRNLGF